MKASYILLYYLIATSAVAQPASKSYMSDRARAVRHSLGSTLLPTAASMDEIDLEIVSRHVVQDANCWERRYAFGLDESLRLSGRRIDFSLIRSAMCEHGKRTAVKFMETMALDEGKNRIVIMGYYDTFAKELYIRP